MWGARLWWTVLVAGCNAPTFACAEDSQCVLSGTPGVCQSDGRCSYPDAECPSGYRYPVLHGGECVPGDGNAGTMSGTADGDGPDAGDDTPTPTSGAGASGDGDSGESGIDDGVDTTVGAEDGEVDDTAGPENCVDETEAGGSIPLAANGCEPLPAKGLIEAVLNGSADVDDYHFIYFGDCGDTLFHAAFVNSDDPLRACAYLDCEGAVIDCEAGSSPETIDGMPGCCTPVMENPQPRFNIACSGSVTVRVKLDSAPNVCAPYTLVYGELPPPE
ncbi:MAG: hypothetical protein AAF721_18340 [Myxococcota bacterium]